VCRRGADPAVTSCVVEVRNRPGCGALSWCKTGQGVVRCRGADPARASCVVEVPTRPGGGRHRRGTCGGS
jgi:hypothetical protein